MKTLPHPEQFEPELQSEPKESSGIDKFLEEATSVGQVDAKDQSFSNKENSDAALSLIEQGRFDDLKVMIEHPNKKAQFQNLSAEVAKGIYKQDPEFALKYIDRFTQLDADFARPFLKPEKSVLQKTYEPAKESLSLITAEEIVKEVDQPSVIARNIDHFSEKDHDKIAQLLIDEHNDSYLLDNFSKFKQLTVATLDKMLNSFSFQEFGARAFLENIHNFQNTTEQYRAVRMLLAEGYVLKNLGELENLDPLIADALIEAGRVDLVSRYSSEGTFSDLSEYAKQKVVKYRDTKTSSVLLVIFAILRPCLT